MRPAETCLPWTACARCGRISRRSAQGQPPPVLVFLEDLTALDDRIHQTRLAALGRLSA